MNWLRRLLGGPAVGTTASPSPRQQLSAPVLTEKDLRDLADRCGLNGAADELIALTAPVFHIIAESPAADAPLGETRLGGAPDLLPGSVWPTARSGLATFLGQFDLADVRARTGSDHLPPSGLLSLFIVEIESAADPVIVQAILTPAGAPLERLAVPARPEDFDGIGPLDPVSIAFQPGISLSQGDIDGLGLESRYPDANILALHLGLAERPLAAIGQWLGRGFDDHVDDQRQVAHARRIGRPGLERYAFVSSREEWEGLKQQSSRLRNGTIYRPWADSGDDEVHWLLDNRAAFDAGVEALQVLVRIDSNPAMNLWINDADPIYILIDAESLGRGDVLDLHATVTQS